MIAPPLEAIASVVNLTVRYGRFTALQDFSVQVPKGCVGLLGPNGAGKTTLIKTLLGFVTPTAGTATILGHSVQKEGAKVRQRVGLMPEQDCHLPGMSAIEFVAYAGELAGMPQAQALRRAHEVLEYSGLGESRYRKVETFSTGMKQRIKLAQALVHGPKLLLLDEPTNGLDPRGREEMLKLIRDISLHKDVNVIVSSHILRDIEKTCESVIVVVKGQLKMQGSIRDLTRIQGHPVDVELKEPSPTWQEAIVRRGITIVSAERNKARLQHEAPTEVTTKMIFEAAREVGAEVRGLSVATKSLEEAFLEVVH
ncbi:MAG: ABC transporter ATP-binding protein [Fimbriimonadaceae bacterium]|nr:ABC transporter ATP-binding protein [Fimbriimonadaceae bacterium]